MLRLLQPHYDQVRDLLFAGRPRDAGGGGATSAGRVTAAAVEARLRAPQGIRSEAGIEAEIEGEDLMMKGTDIMDIADSGAAAGIKS